MKKIIIFCFITMCFVFSSCGWNKVCLQEYKNTSYNLNEEKITVVGKEMIQKKFSDIQCIRTRYEPTGLNLTLWNRSPQVIDEEPYYQTIDKELLYAGRQGDTIHITYREYTVMGLARTPFFQNLYYDLKSSNTIVFQNWTINVIDASNQQIKFKVIQE